MPTYRVFVGVTGASGVIYGVKLLEMLKRVGAELHLSMSRAAERVLRQETEYTPEEVKAMADYFWDEGDLEAPPASGSFRLDAVAVVPCSTKTLAAIAHGLSMNLITRAAEVALKERRRLVLVVRESPLSLVHIRNMELATAAGAVVMPAAPPFYGRPKTVEELVEFFVGRIMDAMGIGHDLIRRWGTWRLRQG